MPRPLDKVLQELKERVQKGSPDFYKPLDDEEERAEVRNYYLEETDLSPDGGTQTLVNSLGTVVCRGWTRIVVGDYGAFVEFSREQANLKALQPKWPGKPKRPVKYLWLETKDAARTKVHHQQATVAYADYKPSMYYVDPADVTVEEKP